MTHGVPSTYNNRGCRCAACKSAWADYLRPKQRARRRALGVPERGPRVVPNGGQGLEKLGPPMHVRVPEELRAALLRVAERDRVTVSTVVRKALEEAVR